MFDFSKCRLDDAEIRSVIASGDQLVVSYCDWQGQEHRFVFRNVAGCQWFSPEGKALSHGVIESDEPFLKMVCETADEEST